MTSGSLTKLPSSSSCIGRTAPKSAANSSSTPTSAPTVAGGIPSGSKPFPSPTTGLDDPPPVLEPEELGQRKDELATSLREARKAAGLTGERLAARCGISQGKISKIETGKVLASATDVERILTALGAGQDRIADLM